MIDSGSIGSGRDAARAEVARGTPTQSHVSPSMLVCEDKSASNPHHVYSYTKKNPARVSHRPCTNEARTDHSRQKGAYSETRSLIKVPRDKRAGGYPLVTGTNLTTPHLKCALFSPGVGVVNRSTGYSQVWAVKHGTGGLFPLRSADL